MNTLQEAVLEFVSKARNSQGYKEDRNSEWLGPWLHELEDRANGIVQRPKRIKSRRIQA